jgi:hypothetical protein
MKRRFQIGILAMALLVAGGALPLATPTIGQASGAAWKVNTGGRCLDNGNSKYAGTSLYLFTCDGTATQDWASEQHTVWYGAGWINITLERNAYSGMCLDVAGDSSKNGTRAWQWTCNANDRAQWMYENSYWTWPTYNIQNSSDAGFGTTNNCLDDHFSSTAQWAAVDFWSCAVIVGTNQAQDWSRTW